MTDGEVCTMVREQPDLIQWRFTSALKGIWARRENEWMAAGAKPVSCACLLYQDGDYALAWESISVAE